MANEFLQKLPFGWKWQTLDSICSRVSVGHVGETTSVFTERKAIPFLRSQNVRPGKLMLDDVKYVTEEFHKKSKKSQLIAGDVLIVRVGHNRGDCCVLPSGLGEVNCANIVFARLIDIRYSLFVGYFLNSVMGRAALLAVTTGSAQAVLNTKAVAKVLVPVPPAEVAKNIGSCLSLYDSKIDINLQINQTLEQMAQTLFKSWFVDFDPVIDNALDTGNEIPDTLQERAEQRRLLRTKADFKSLPAETRALFPSEFEETELGWVPKGWEVKNLGELVTVKRGGSPRPIQDFLVPEGLPWVKISDATASDSRFLSTTKEFIKPEGLNKTVLLKTGELILSNSATPGLPKFLELDACIHDGWLYFPEKKHISDLYLYQLFLEIRPLLVQQGNGSVFTNLKTDILKQHSMVVPTSNVLSAFEKQAVIFHSKIQQVNQENQSLQKIRDILLPKLISGELALDDLPAGVAEAAEAV